MVLEGSRTMSHRLVIQEEGEDEEEVFFDSRDDISSSSSSCPVSPSGNVSQPQENVSSLASVDPWIKDPGSVQARREIFMRLMGLDLSRSFSLVASEAFKSENSIEPELDRISLDSSVELDNSSTENLHSMSSWSSQASSPSYDELSEENFICSIKNLDDGTVFVFYELSKDGTVTNLREVGSNRTLSVNEFEKKFGPSSFVLQLMRRDSSTLSNSDRSIRRAKVGWLRRLGAAAHIIDRHKEVAISSVSDSTKGRSSHSRRVKVHPYKKQLKELSALDKVQDIKAHDGAILTLKFSPDGQYLATGGEDGVIRVWCVLVCEGKDVDIIAQDPSSICFTVNHNSELVALNTDRDKRSKFIGMKRVPKCVIIPHYVFQLAEKPIHEFHGHDGDVLDLSWSNNNVLLSSSMDKTVRLWQVGSDCCLKVFSHSNYVTCVHFNPVDENYFLSGSIDGKVRIWNIPACRVVDWVDIEEIVTAVCYQPDGKGAVAGTMSGECRFYDASDNHVKLREQISLQGKKKSRLGRITGFQFCPTDHRKLMVTSADSQIRILDGVNMISKYKGLRNSGTQIYASFTGNGRHIISASTGSNVYIWNHISDDPTVSTRVTTSWSSECFFSSNTSIALPWHGIQSGNPLFVTSPHLFSQLNISKDQDGIAYGSNIHVKDSFSSNSSCSSSGSFSVCHDVFSEVLPKDSATWPEEKLPFRTADASALDKSHLKTLKDSLQSTSHMWGQVIVTAGWDGWIRSYQNYGLPVHI